MSWRFSDKWPSIQHPLVRAGHSAASFPLPLRRHLRLPDQARFQLRQPRRRETLRQIKTEPEHHRVPGRVPTDKPLSTLQTHPLLTMYPTFRQRSEPVLFAMVVSSSERPISLATMLTR